MIAVVTFDDAELLLEEAFSVLAALPDRERGFLSAGSRSCWPAILRDVQADYADADAVPRRQLTRKDMALAELVLTGEGALFMAVPVAQRRLVARVVGMRLAQGGAGFSWSAVWQWDDRLRRTEGRHRVTSDAVRKSYGRAITALAEAMDHRRGALVPWLGRDFGRELVA